MKINHFRFYLILGIFLICSLFTISKPFAQTSTRIHGRIVDNNQEAVSYTNVSLIGESNSKLITGTISDGEGFFSLQVQISVPFRIVISAIGFKTFKSEVLDIAPGAEIDFGRIVLEEEISSLKEVTVKVTRPDIVIEADKTTIIIEGTVMAEGNNTLDILARSPGVFVDSDGNITLNGQPGVVVMINDRQTYMSAQELSSFLRAMPADNIKSIEVINSPGAGFDAEGTAGVINIKLKKYNNIQGIFGNVQMGGVYNGLLSQNFGGSLNMKKGKWTIHSNFSINEFNNVAIQELERNFNLTNEAERFLQNSENDFRRSNLLFVGGADYDFNSKHNAGFNVQLSHLNGGNERNSLSNITSSSSQDVNYMFSNLLNTTNNDRVFANFHYSGQLDSIGTKLTADIDITKMTAYANEVLDNSYWVNDMPNDYYYNKIRNVTDLDFNILTGKVDLVMPLSKGRVFEAGLKGSYVYTDNELDLSRSELDNEFYKDPGSNHFIYDEKVLAAYASYKANLSPKFTYQLGLRSEYSDITGTSLTLGQVNNQNYLSLFPSGFLQHKVNKNYSINYTANRRITRPNYNQLNPFIIFLDPFTSNQGNPHLVPQFAYNFEMSHVFKKAYQLSLGYSRIENVFQSILEQDTEERTMRSIPTNLDHSQNFNVRMILPYEITSWWNTSNMLQMNYNQFQSQLGDAFLNVNQMSFMGRSQHNISLPKSFKLEVMGIYFGPQLAGQWRIGSMGWADIGLSKSFQNDKWYVSVNGTDIFRTQLLRGIVNFDEIDTRFNLYLSNQAIRMTARYKFTKGKSFRTQGVRTGSAEERDRLN
jgi:hypothetical protein